MRRGRRSASSGPVLLVQGEGYIAEPGTGTLNPLPAIGRLGSCGDVARAVCSLASSRHRWALELKSPREVASSSVDSQEAFRLRGSALDRSSVLFGSRPGCPWPGSKVCIELTPSTGQRFSAGRVCWAWVRGSQPPAPEAGRLSCRCGLFAQASARVRSRQCGRSRSVTGPESSKRAPTRRSERCNRGPQPIR